MQGVDILLMMLSTQPGYFDFLARDFYECLIEEKLLERCKAVVVRIVYWKNDNTKLRTGNKHVTADGILSECGITATTPIKDKLCKYRIFYYSDV